MSNNKQIVNMRVEFDPAPIRHVAIQCPHCNRWFHGSDVAPEGEWLSYDYQLETTTFTCPVCNKTFGRDYSPSFSGFCSKVEFNIKEVGSAEECYKDCLQKKVTWE